MRLLSRRHFLGAIPTVAALNCVADEEDISLAAELEQVRIQYDLPAVGGAVISSEGLRSAFVTGIRRRGGEAKAVVGDRWHLGSNTKAFTATLAGIAVESGRIGWETKLADVFNSKADDVDGSTVAEATLVDLLSHRSGLPKVFPWPELSHVDGDMLEQRSQCFRAAMKLRGLPEPGDRFEYSNWGYLIAAHMLEKVLGISWELQLERAIFSRIGIVSATTGPAQESDTLWPHAKDGAPYSEATPSFATFPPMGPAGSTLQMSLGCWAKFIAEHLAGRQGRGRLLKQSTYERIHSPAEEGEPYALGWYALERSWGGRVLNHHGTNLLNYSVAWLAPEKDFAVAACTNQGSDFCRKALDDVVGILISKSLQ